MIVTTTPNIEGHAIEEYLGIVTGVALVYANILWDIISTMNSRSTAYQQRLEEVKNLAISNMSQNAEQLGADAVVGVSLDYERLRRGMLMVAVSGTAVRTT
jgi:uncharacterized protein YbjQ (UPF0145 family)